MFKCSEFLYYRQQFNIGPHTFHGITLQLNCKNKCYIADYPEPWFIYLYDTQNQNHNHRLYCTYPEYLFWQVLERNRIILTELQVLHAFNSKLGKAPFHCTLAAKQNVRFKSLSFWVTALKQKVSITSNPTLHHW